MRRARRGTSTLELVFAIPVLLLILGASVDFAFISLINHQLGAAARAASRWGITGQKPEALDPNVTPIAWCGNGPTPVDIRIGKMRQLIAGALGILNPTKVCLAVLSYNSGYSGIGDPEPFIDKNGNGAYDPGESYTDVNGDGVWSADQGSTTLGSGGDVTVYELRYHAAPITGLTPGLPADMSFTARVVARNEPYINK